MNRYKLRYGDTEIELEQSRTLIGVRPRSARPEEARAAVQRGLQGASWKDEGSLGGFQIVAIEDSSRRRRRRARPDPAATERSRSETHVFEIAQGASAFVPTGDLYLEFGCKRVRARAGQELIERYALSIRERRDEHGFVIAITRRFAAMPMQGRCKPAWATLRVAVAEPDAGERCDDQGADPARPIPCSPSNWHLRNIRPPARHHRRLPCGLPTRASDPRLGGRPEPSRRRRSSSPVIADGFDLTHPDRKARQIYPALGLQPAARHVKPGPNDWHGSAGRSATASRRRRDRRCGSGDHPDAGPLGPLSAAQTEAMFDQRRRSGPPSWLQLGRRQRLCPLSTRAKRAINAAHGTAARLLIGCPGNAIATSRCGGRDRSMLGTVLRIAREDRAVDQRPAETSA